MTLLLRLLIVSRPLSVRLLLLGFLSLGRFLAAAVCPITASVCCVGVVLNQAFLVLCRLPVLTLIPGDLLHVKRAKALEKLLAIQGEADSLEDKQREEEESVR